MAWCVTGVLREWLILCRSLRYGTLIFHEIRRTNERIRIFVETRVIFPTFNDPPGYIPPLSDHTVTVETYYGWTYCLGSSPEPFSVWKTLMCVWLV